MDEDQGDERRNEDQVGNTGRCFREAQCVEPEHEGDAHLDHTDVRGPHQAIETGNADIREEHAEDENERQGEREVQEKADDRVPVIPRVVDPVQGPDDRAGEGQCHAEGIRQPEVQEVAPRGDYQDAGITHEPGKDFPRSDALSQ